MAFGVSFNVGLVPDSRCNRSERAPPIVESIEGKVLLISKILSKELLCRHDVDLMNHTYREIDLIERRLSEIPASSSKDVLKRIDERVQEIIGAKKPTPQDWVSFYHLRRFADPVLELKTRFASEWKRLPKDDSFLTNIVENIPCCESGKRFDRDVQKIIGPDLLPKVKKTLDKRHKEIQNQESLKQQIAEKKEEFLVKNKPILKDFPRT